LIEILFEGDLSNLLEISIVVPSGHIQPQKNLPKNIVKNKIISAGQKSREILRLSIKSNRGIRGLNRRNISEDRESSYGYRAFRNRKIKNNKKIIWVIRLLLTIKNLG
jgi:hypothetical protein